MRLRDLKRLCETPSQKKMFNTICKRYHNQNRVISLDTQQNVLRAGRAMKRRVVRRRTKTVRSPNRRKRLHKRATQKQKRTPKANAQNRVFLKYLPKSLSPREKRKQLQEMVKSRRLYFQYLNNRKGKKRRTNQQAIYVRKKTNYKNKPSKHVVKAKKLYRVSSVKPTAEFARKTGCSIGGLRKIVKKGIGAYQSGGSRVNQNPSSWAYARLASATTGGKASKVDYKILLESCGPKSKALQLAIPPKK